LNFKRKKKIIMEREKIPDEIKEGESIIEKEQEKRKSERETEELRERYLTEEQREELEKELGENKYLREFKRDQKRREEEKPTKEAGEEKEKEEIDKGQETLEETTKRIEEQKKKEEELVKEKILEKMRTGKEVELTEEEREIYERIKGKEETVEEKEEEKIEKKTKEEEKIEELRKNLEGMSCEEQEEFFKKIGVESVEEAVGNLKKGEISGDDFLKGYVEIKKKEMEKIGEKTEGEEEEEKKEIKEVGKEEKIGEEKKEKERKEQVLETVKEQKIENEKEIEAQPESKKEAIKKLFKNPKFKKVIIGGTIVGASVVCPAFGVGYGTLGLMSVKAAGTAWSIVGAGSGIYTGFRLRDIIKNRIKERKKEVKEIKGKVEEAVAAEIKGEKEKVEEIGEEVKRKAEEVVVEDKKLKEQVEGVGKEIKKAAEEGSEEEVEEIIEKEEEELEIGEPREKEEGKKELEIGKETKEKEKEKEEELDREEIIEILKKDSAAEHWPDEKIKAEVDFIFNKAKENNISPRILAKVAVNLEGIVGFGSAGHFLNSESDALIRSITMARQITGEKERNLSEAACKIYKIAYEISDKASVSAVGDILKDKEREEEIKKQFLGERKENKEEIKEGVEAVKNFSSDISFEQKQDWEEFYKTHLEEREKRINDYKQVRELLEKVDIEKYSIRDLKEIIAPFITPDNNLITYFRNELDRGDEADKEVLKQIMEANIKWIDNSIKFFEDIEKGK